MPLVDLHLHSTASDGTWTPEEVVRQAAVAGVQFMALTDHDTMEGRDVAEPLAASLGIEFIPAVELNTDAGGAEMDILGYFADPDVAWFQALLQARQRARIQRARDIVARLQQLGLEIDYERIRELAHGVVARPHIAQAMIEKGYVASQTEAYERYIGFGAPAYVERDALHPTQAMRWVQAAGGVAVLAHPGLLGDDARVKALIDAGLDGLEAYYVFHTPEQTRHYLALAREYGLVVTAGSDAHGPGRAKSHPIGVSVPDDVLQAFRARVEKAYLRRRLERPADLRLS